jgi:hypothetical protein
LTESWRKLHASGYHDAHKCDKNDAPQIDGKTWFRFVEPAGTQLPVTPNARSRKTEYPCGTQATAYLTSSHPTIADGVVSRQRCYVIGSGHGNENRECSSMDVAACPSYQSKSFYIYKLLKPSGICAYAYCAE